MFLTFKLGMVLGLSIIISIGAQNLFLIKQGLRNEYPYLAALMCTLCDVTLILIGATGASMLIFEFPLIRVVMLIFGVIFLVYYGCLAMMRGYNHAVISASLDKLRDQQTTKMPALKLILLALTFSFLNPQAILDTTMIIGSSANQYPDETKYLFIIGTMVASFIWFFGIAIATSIFGKKLMNVKFWSALEWISGIIMIAFAIKFFSQLIQI